MVSFLPISLANEEVLTDMPVIGILSVPYGDDKSPMTEAVDAFYTQYLNTAGARVVPLSFKLQGEPLMNLMRQLNGVLFTGGSTAFALFNETTKKYDLTPFGKGAKRVFHYAKEINDNGVYFPIWGTCMGFQLLNFLITEDPTIVKGGCSAMNFNAELIFTPKATTSRMFSIFSYKEMKYFSEKGLTYNSHHYFVDYLDYFKYLELGKFYDVLAYSKDKDNKVAFITAMEAKHYPFYGVQFHPEIRQYKNLGRIKGEACAKQAQDFANFFVNEARKSSNIMEWDECLKRSIWNVPIQRFDNSFFHLFP